MNYLQAQMLHPGADVEFNGRKAQVQSRLFDDQGLTSHIKLVWHDDNTQTGFIDVREMGAVRFSGRN